MRHEQGRLGFAMPVIGLGTWCMGEDPARRADEVAALRLGLERGATLIDTAEMYADGEAERIAGEAIAGRRDQLLLVSKVLPHNASRRGTIAAAERSLQRLGTDRLDLYLLHWQGTHPLEETLAAFRQLVRDGKILHYGLSNFDTADAQRALGLPGGEVLVTNQVLYNLQRRWPEASLLPWCREHDVLLTAYSPLEQARLPVTGALAHVARRHGCTPYQIALAWTIRRPGVVAIPKATRPQHVNDNLAAAEIRLEPDDLARLDQAFPPPPAGAGMETL